MDGMVQKVCSCSHGWNLSTDLGMSIHFFVLREASLREAYSEHKAILAIPVCNTDVVWHAVCLTNMILYFQGDSDMSLLLCFDLTEPAI